MHHALIYEAQPQYVILYYYNIINSTTLSVIRKFTEKANYNFPNSTNFL